MDKKNKMSTGQHNSPRPMTKKIVPQRLLVNIQSETCVTTRDGPLFLSGVTFSVKKLFRSCNWLKKIVCFKVMKGKNCLQSKEKFFEMH